MKTANSFAANATPWAGLVLIALLLAAGCAQPHVAGRTSIPMIASIAKIQIGNSTQEDVERDWGRGKSIIGGHPNSGRLWRVRGTPWVLNTDGFEYSERGLVVDRLTISEDREPGEGVPFAQITASELAWLGEVSLGMSEANVTEVLKRNGLPVRQAEPGCETQAKGFHALVNGGLFQTWTVRFSFKDGLLDELQMEARQ